jgi:lipopolysaccharide export LptBFGC system permease protein LptF
MKIKHLLSFFFLAFVLISSSCSKDNNTIAQNQQNIKKLWKLDNYLINGTDMTSMVTVTAYTESFQDNGKYDRSFTDKNNNKITQNGAYEFENANRLKISGVGSIEMSSHGTISSSYYDIVKLTETEFWYSFVNGNAKHEIRLSRKQ